MRVASEEGLDPVGVRSDNTPLPCEAAGPDCTGPWTAVYKNGFAGLDITITEARALHADLGLSIAPYEAANPDDEE